MNHVCVPEEVYFGLYNKIGRLTEENRNLKHLNENQLNMIMDLRNEINDLKKQKEGLCELVGKTKKESEDLRANYNQFKKECDEVFKQLYAGCSTCPDNGNSDASEAALKDADAKIQSANDKAANAKKEAKQAKETAERYREENFVLHRQIDQFKKLNDELIKELARQQNAELIMEFDRKGE